MNLLHVLHLKCRPCPTLQHSNSFFIFEMFSNSLVLVPEKGIMEAISEKERLRDLLQATELVSGQKSDFFYSHQRFWRPVLNTWFLLDSVLWATKKRQQKTGGTFFNKVMSILCCSPSTTAALMQVSVVRTGDVCQVAAQRFSQQHLPTDDSTIP